MPATTRILVVLIAVIGFLFDTYELLMLPVIGTTALQELLGAASPQAPEVRAWTGRLLWLAALCGGVFGLLGGWMIDRFGRKRIMVGSILLYSLSPLAAAFSTELWQFVLFRCTTFIGVCVEMVAAVTWLAELFSDKRSRERVIAWSLAAASLGGLLVTIVDQEIKTYIKDLPAIPTFQGESKSPWRYTLLTGLVPGALILVLMPFVPESLVWSEKKKAGTLRRPSFRELFAPALLRTTLVTTILSACGYAAAFGALQLTPTQVIQAHKSVSELRAAAQQTEKEAAADEKLKPAAAEAKKTAMKSYETKKSSIQLWQELGGLTGRILLAILVSVVATRTLLRLFLVPGIALFPLTYLELIKDDFAVFALAIFFCGLLTVAQFSYLSEFLPKVFPLHLRGTGGSFATNVGGRMFGTMAAILNTGLLAGQFEPGPMGVAKAAAVIGGSVYLIAFLTSFFLPTPVDDMAK